jgi:hypothetical protein
MAKQFDKLYPNLKIKQPLVLSWVKDKEKWHKKWAQSGAAWSAKHTHQTQHPEVTEMMDLWVSKAMADGIQLMKEVLCQKWTKFANLVGIPQDNHLNLSEG